MMGYLGPLCLFPGLSRMDSVSGNQHVPACHYPNNLGNMLGKGRGEVLESWRISAHSVAVTCILVPNESIHKNRLLFIYICTYIKCFFTYIIQEL